MSAKIVIPEELKADIPQNNWGKVLAATPVVMTVIATLLAGLSSGEMVRAQYDRSLAAQQQSKAGDQWNYFQAKRLRAAMQRTTIDLLHGTAAVHPLEAATLAARLGGTPAQAALESPTGRATLDCLAQGTLPAAPAAVAPDPRITTVLDAVEGGQSDADITRLLTPLKPADLATALDAATAHVRAVDSTLKPVNSMIDTLEKALTHAAASDAVTRDFIAARLAYAAQRYDAESRLNQGVAQLLELQVRKSNLSAERHHSRSQRFFYGMLVAQMAVIISTFSMATKKRSFLWAFAATAGVAAIGFASYVYLFV